MPEDRKDTYKPAKATMEGGRDPVMPRGGTTNHSAPNIDDAIREKCIKAGIRTDLYLDAWQRFKGDVAERYDEQHYSADWRVWKAQTLLWDHFFRPEIFPGKMPIVYPSQGSQPNPVSSRNMASTTTLQSLHSSPSKDLSSQGHNAPAYNSLIKKERLDKANPSRSPTPISGSPVRTNNQRLTNIMAAKATDQGINMTTFSTVYNEKKDISDHRFRSESDEWRAWYTQSLVWGYFFKDSPFPGVEPARRYHLSADDVKNPPQSGGRVGEKWVKTPFVDNRPMAPTGPLAMQYTRPSAAPTRPATQPVPALSSSLPDPDVYRTYEKVMETKATALGMRREFFQYLQKKRDSARMHHGKCDSGYRAWLADSLTWKSFFPGDVFPGKEPVGKEIHHSSCVKRPRPFPASNSSLDPRPSSADHSHRYQSPGAKDVPRTNAGFPEQGNSAAFGHLSNGLEQGHSLHPSRAGFLEQGNGAIKGGYSNRPERSQSSHIPKAGSKPNPEITTDPRGYPKPEATSVPQMNNISAILKQSQNTKPLQVPIPPHQTVPSWDDVGRLLISGARPYLIDCSEVMLKNISYNLLTDSQRSLVGSALGCTIIFHERKRSQSAGLTIQVAALAGASFSYDKLMGATYSIASWIGAAIKEGGLSPKLSSFYRNRILIGDNSSRPDEEPPEADVMVDSETQTEDSTSPIRNFPISLGDPEHDWNEYADAFGTSEVDRVMIEEQAKVEGVLRMVLDQQTQDIVSLKEFEERTRLRCLSATKPDSIRDQTPGEAPQLESDTTPTGSVERNFTSDFSGLANRRQNMGEEDDLTQGNEETKPNGLNILSDDFELETPISSITAYTLPKDPAHAGEIQEEVKSNLGEALGNNPAEPSNPKKGSVGSMGDVGGDLGDTGFALPVSESSQATNIPLPPKYIPQFSATAGMILRRILGGSASTNTARQTLAPPAKHVDRGQENADPRMLDENYSPSAKDTSPLQRHEKRKAEDEEGSDEEASRAEKRVCF